MPLTVQFGSQETLAQAYARARDLFPTDMSTAEIQQLDAAIRRASVFSARTTNAQYVQAIADVVDQLLGGQINEATGRALLQDTLDMLRYDPAKGFPGDDATRIPPAEVGDLRDLSSERRVKLVLDTQERMAANYAFQRAGQTDEARYQFPAYELVRIYTRHKERDDWGKRWVAACHEAGDEQALDIYLKTGRMIARKDSGVWQALGDGAGGYQDTLGNKYPPFAFESGLGWREVDRETCLSLGLIKAEEVPVINDAEFAEELRINREAFDPEFLSALEADLLAA